MTRRARWILTGAALMTALGSLGAMQLRGNRSVSEADNDQPDGLQFRLSEGKSPDGSHGEIKTPPPAQRLSDVEADRILARLTAIKALPGDEVDFNLREGSLPAPRAGATVSTTFPPPPSGLAPPTVETGPLTVRRVSPQGAVPLADRVSVTFSQPMVAVTSQEDAARNVPVTLSPAQGGVWRWLGTQTLIYDAGSGKRLPMATAYTVTVPAGTKSATGGVLAQESTTTFQTPTVRLLDHWPWNDAQPRDPVIWLAFDQRIDPDAVQATVEVRANGQKVAIRRATDIEIARTPGLRGRRDFPRERTLAVKPVAPLPGSASIEVVVAPGTPSLEGPLKTDSPQSFTFQTYGPLRVVASRCTWDPNEPCRPENPWQIEFTNDLDAEAFDPAWVTIAPAAPGVEPQAMGRVLMFQGLKKGRTTYTVTLSPKIKDIYGQTLEDIKPIVFKIGPALPQVQGPARGFTVLDPGAPPRALFQSVNVRSARVRLFAVTPQNWEAWLGWINGGPRRGNPPGKLVSEKTVSLGGERDDWTETSVDLSPALEKGLGNVIVWWDVPELRRPNVEPPTGFGWYQATKIGLSAHADPDELFAWATDLATGKPLPELKVALTGADVSATTASDGLARFALSDRPARMVTARRGDDTAFLPASFWQYNDAGWRKQARGDQRRWFVFNDRGLYKPGETVKIKGWIRTQKAGKGGDLVLPQGLSQLNFVLRDSRGNEVQKGTVGVNPLGGFDLSLTLPKTMNLGNATVDLGGYGHSFNVQEFRRPEFEVTARSESPGPHVVGGPGAELSVNAHYYAGGGLPNAPANWTVYATPSSYTPPGRNDFTFGTWVPWWGGFRGGMDEDFGGRGFRRPGRFGRGIEPQTFAGVTDASGTHRLHIDFDTVKPARPYSVSAQATIQDVNRQAFAASASLLVHPSERYVGLRGKRLFVEKGKPLTIEAIVCDIDGKLEAGREIRFRAARKEWGYRKGRWQEWEVDPKEWTVRSGKDVVSTEYTPKDGGTYSVKATVLDGRERPNETELTLWVAGGAPPLQQNLAQETVTLVPTKKEFQPGDTAEVLIQAPFWPAEALVTLRRDGIVKTERFKMDGPSRVLRIPIVEGYLPNIGLQVDLVGAATRTDRSGKQKKELVKRPAFATGALDLSVPPKGRKLAVTATPAQPAIAPGGKTSVTVTVKDAAGKPVSGGEAAVVVVDESVLALAGWELGDPLAAFYPNHGTDAYDAYLRSHLVLEDTARVAQDPSRSRGGGMMGGAGGRAFNMAAPAGAPMAMAKSAAALESMADRSPAFAFDAAKRRDQDGNGGQDPIAVRENFDALAVFAAAVKTDANGQVTVPVSLPDNLTRYRIVAVAVEGGRLVGSGESSLTARLPLMARPSAPRFLNFGDQFELPVVVQNQTDAPMTVDVAVRSANATMTEGRGRRVTVPANDRVEVRFPSEAARPGTARFQIAAVAGSDADAAEVSLPVWTPATTEAFATYGVVDEGAIAQPVQAPGEVVPQFGGLEITTTSTALQELTDAYIYLAQYPYGCAEQISSRVLATAALKDILSAFKAEGMPDPKEVAAMMDRDLKRLEEIQNEDGSYGFWIRGERPWPYVGVHVAHALVLAKQKDYPVPQPLWDRSMSYLKQIEQKIPADYSESARRCIIAYALYVRHLAGDSDLPRARRLLAEKPLPELGPEVVGWMVNILANDPQAAQKLAEARNWFNNNATETAAAAHFAFSYSDNDYLVLHSNRRADAIVLDALIADQPKSDLIPKLVRGLLDGRKKGAWSGTQENAFVLLALDRYFRTYEGVTPNFVARVWLGDKFAGEGKFAGRTTDRVETKVPMRYLTQTPGKQNLTLAKEGPGRLYYRIGMRYAPKSLNLGAADYGFSVQRVYEPIDKPDDVKRGPNGEWIVRAGAKVRVRVTMVATTRRYHVALVDPLPAGFEALNPELRGTEQLLGETGGSRIAPYGGWWWHWWEHQNLRDERAEAFSSLLWEGAYEYTYVCRATTPGRFVVPPAKAEEMYSPETFGRSATDRVRVE